MLKEGFRRVRPERPPPPGVRGVPRGPRAAARTAARLWPGALERRLQLVLTYAAYLGDDPAGWRLAHLRDEVAGLFTVVDSIAVATPRGAGAVHEAVRHLRGDIVRLLEAAALVAAGRRVPGWWVLVDRAGESVRDLAGAVRGYERSQRQQEKAS
jgi:hypothetical protein